MPGNDLTLDDLGPSQQKVVPVRSSGDLTLDDLGPPSSTAPLMPRVDQSVKGAISSWNSPNQQQPARDFGQFAGNAWGDAKTLMQGLGVIGSVANQRVIDTYMPKGVYQPELFQKNWMDAMLPKGAIQLGNPYVEPGAQNDVGEIIKIGGGIVDHYKTKFVDPILSGKFDQVGNYFLSNPVLAVSDVLPIAGPIGKGLSIASKAAGLTPKIAEAANLIKNGVQNTPLVGELAENVGLLKNPAEQVMKKEIQKANADFLNGSTNKIQQLDKLYKEIPKDLQQDLYAAGEYTDPLAYERIQQNPAAKAYLELANDVTDSLAGVLMDRQILSPDEIMLAKYGPATMARHGLDRADQLIPNDPRLLVMKAEMEAAGIKPNYMRNVNAAKSAKSNQLAGSLFSKGFDGKAKNIGGDKSFLRQREAETLTAVERGSANANIKGAILEEMAFLHLQEMFIRILENPHLTGEGKVVNLHNYLAGAAQNAGVSPEALQQILKSGEIPQFVEIPHKAAAALELAVRSETRWPVYDDIGNLYKHNTLGLNPVWAVNQGIQNAMIAGVSMNRSPRDVATTILAGALAFDKKVTNRLPADWFQDVTPTPPLRELKVIKEQQLQEAATEGPIMTRLTGGKPLPKPLAESLATVGAGYTGFTQRVFNTTGRGDNYFRATKGLHEMMRQVEAADPATRVALTEAFDVMARTSQIEKALANPAVMEKAGEDILRWYGDYSPLAAKKYWKERKLMPFYLWNVHAMSVAKSLPSKSPVKNALLNRLYVMAPELFQDKDIPDAYRRSGIKIDATTPNGGQAYRMSSGFTPFMTSYEILEQAGAVATGTAGLDYGGEGRVGMSAMHPVPQAGAMMVGVNPSTFRPYINPHLIQGQNKQYKQLPNGQYAEVGGLTAHLPLPNIAAKTVMPSGERVGRKVIAGAYKDEKGKSGYAPSDYTTLGDAAIKRTQKHPEGLKQWGILQSIVGEATKSLPVEGTMTKAEEDGIKQWEQRMVNQKARRQYFRTDRD